MHTQHVHNINSYMVVSVIQHFVWPCLFSSVLTYHCVKPQVSKNKHLAFTLLLIKNVIPSVSRPEMSLIKPSGFWQTRVKYLSKAEWILANLLSKAEWILANLLSKAGWILANLLSKARWTLAKSFTKPRGFSQTFYQKPGGFSQTFYQKPGGLWRNLLRNRVDFQQTFINQTDSLQDFSLIKNSHVLSISFRMLVVTPLR